MRPAATVLLLRDGAAGIEVFLVQRHRSSGFLPNAWVFPGGRVEDADRAAVALGADALSSRLGLTPDEARAYGVAALRETWEEAGLWLGGGAGPGEGPVDLRGLVAWSWWVTPEIEPKRFDTRFFAVRADGPARHDDREVVASAWMRPADAIAIGAALPLAPPTWWTLFELSAHACVADALAFASARPLARIQPILRFGEAGIELVLPGHAEHPDGEIEGLPDHVVYDAGTWRASRRGLPVASMPALPRR
jgi:8-oxo-dGTP pyrophosphatase MutT (NUDIX family)